MPLCTVVCAVGAQQSNTAAAAAVVYLVLRSMLLGGHVQTRQKLYRPPLFPHFLSTTRLKYHRHPFATPATASPCPGRISRRVRYA